MSDKTVPANIIIFDKAVVKEKSSKIMLLF